jgi:hypothetical protein
MNKLELLKLIKDNPSNFTNILKKYHTKIYNKIDALYEYDKFSQKLYDYIHNSDKKCVICNRETSYEGINSGYKKTCSNKCKGMLRHIESVENRKCVICGNQFEIYKKREKTTCSLECLNELNKTDIVNDKRIESYKKTIKSKYGVDWFSHTDEFKSKLKKLHAIGKFNYKEIVEKSKKTKLSRYGDENYNNIEKAGDTFFEKYGVRNYSQTDEFKELHFNRVLDRLPTNIEFIDNSKLYNGVSSNRYQFKCLDCNTIFTSSLNNGTTPLCRACNPTKWNSSTFEVDVLDYIYSIYDDEVVRSSRDIIPPKELDIYLPNSKLAIECNGNYWHSDLNGKDKNYHLNKTIDCNKNGIRLIHVFEDEWLEKQDIVKQRLKHILGKDETKLWARKCEVKEITSKEASSFLTETHIQGSSKSSVNLGIFYKHKLMGVMTFSKRKIFNKNGDWELVRFSTKNVIVGGASKLFNYFIKNYNPEKVITYSDIRWNTGNVYNQMGFKFIKITSPNYFYLGNGHHRFSRINFQKHKLKDKLEKFDPNLTEWENMQLNGYDRIWDCGNLKYEWTP